MSRALNRSPRGLMLRKACADPGAHGVLARNEMHTCKADPASSGVAEMTDNYEKEILCI